MNVIDTLKAYVKMDARRQRLPAFTAFRYAFEDNRSAERVSHNTWLENASPGVIAGPLFIRKEQNDTISPTFKVLG